MNPIEGLWCYLKQYVRKRNVQNYLELHNLIREAMLSYQSSDLNFKLWKRFWTALNAYKIGKKYEEVLKAFFGAKSSANVTTHKKIINFNTLIPRNI